VATVAVFTGMFAFSANGIAASDDDNESKIQQGFNIAPVPLNLSGKNRALVGMGSYLVNAVGRLQRLPLRSVWRVRSRRRSMFRDNRRW